MYMRCVPRFFADAQNDRKGVDHNIRKFKNVIKDISETHIKKAKTSKKRKIFVKIRKACTLGIDSTPFVSYFSGKIFNYG